MIGDVVLALVVAAIPQTIAETGAFLRQRIEHEKNDRCRHGRSRGRLCPWCSDVGRMPEPSWGGSTRGDEE